MKKKVLAAMSGGVDSAVAAALLLEQGYDVAGVILKLWDGAQTKERSLRTCCSLEDVNDARNAAFNLGIPFYVLNFEEIFKEKVVDYFISTYMEGATPNPCIACNRYVKFDELFNRIKAYGMDYLATGHYSKIELDASSGRYLLKKAEDASKDQSYVLYMLKQNQLERLLLPLGKLNKSEVRSIAAGLGLKVSDKPDSQDICFVEKGKYSDFLKHNSKNEIKPGYFVNRRGEILGKHRGIPEYTIGQRRGLGISAGKNLYVVEKRTEDNTIVLGDREETFCRQIIASDMNYIPFDHLKDTIRIKARTRYSTPETDAFVIPAKNGGAEITFDMPQPFAAPGQSVVLYDKDMVVGGGIIERLIYD